MKWEDDSLSEMSERLRLLGVLYEVSDTIDLFENATEYARTSIYAREVADIDFDYWTDIRKWNVPEWVSYDDFRQSYLHLEWNIKSNREFISQKLANDISYYFPDSPRNERYNDEIARSGIRDFLNLYQGVFFNLCQLRFAIFRAIQALIQTLHQLHVVLYQDHSDNEFEAWYDELWLEFSTKLISNISKNYASVFNQRLTGPNRDWLMERFGDAATAFWNTRYMQARKDAFTNHECKNQTIFFDIPTLSKDQQRKFFHGLMEIGTFDDKGYHIDKKANAGKCLYLLYLENVQEQAIIDFFTFVITAQLISSDLIRLPQEKKTTKKKEVRVAKTTKKRNTSVPYTIRYINANEQSRTNRLRLLMLGLQKLQWIEEPKSIDDFMDLFNGAPRECNIKWTDTLNQATIYYFLQQLLEQPFIEKVTGCSARSLMMNQFHFDSPRADEKRITTENKRIINHLISIINPQQELPTKSETITDDVADMNSTYWNYLEDGLHATKDINSRI